MPSGIIEELNLTLDKEEMTMLKSDWSVRAETVRLGGEYSLRITNAYGKVKEYPGITSDRERLDSLVNKINGMQVSELHIDDIIEDFLE